MVTIRLRRTGCNNGPSFRVVATDSRSPRDGRFIELGTGTFEANIQNYDDVTYYWNDEEVSEETYKAELARLFDTDRATYIDTGVEYDAFAAQLRS